MGLAIGTESPPVTTREWPSAATPESRSGQRFGRSAGSSASSRSREQVKWIRLPNRTGRRWLPCLAWAIRSDLPWRQGTRRAGSPSGNPGTGLEWAGSRFWRASGNGLDLLHEGRTNPERIGDFLDKCDWGHALAFVADIDNDDVPDLLVTAPYGGIINRQQLDLISASSGKLLHRWTPTTPEYYLIGHALDVSADGRRVLVGGTVWSGHSQSWAVGGGRPDRLQFPCYPDDLSEQGIATVFDSRDLGLLKEHRVDAVLRVP